MLGARARDMKQKARQPTEDSEVIFRLTHSDWQRRVCKEEVTPHEPETSGVHGMGLGAGCFIFHPGAYQGFQQKALSGHPQNPGLW